MKQLDYKIHYKVPEGWDNLVAEHGGLFTQSSRWANLYSTLCIGSGIYIEIYEGKKKVLLMLVVDMLIGGTILTSLPLMLRRILLRIPRLHSYSMHLQPTILDSSLYKEQVRLECISAETLSKLSLLAKQEGKSILPASYVCFTDKSLAIKLKNEASFHANLTGTTRIHLDSEQENYKNLDYSIRNKISKAQRNGVTIEQVSDEHMTAFLKVMKKSWQQNNLLTNPLNYYKILYRENKQYIKFFAAKANGRILAGAGVMHFGNSILEFIIFSTLEGRTKNAGSGELLQWEIIKYGITNNATYVDLNMIAVAEDADMEEKIKNINSFKLKWSGDVLYGINIVELNVLARSLSSIKNKLFHNLK